MQVEHDVANPNQPECPPSHPRFLFHLGGNGPAGLMTREHFVPRYDLVTGGCVAY